MADVAGHKHRTQRRHVVRGACGLDRLARANQTLAQD